MNKKIFSSIIAFILNLHSITAFSSLPSLYQNEVHVKNADNLTNLLIWSYKNDKTIVENGVGLAVKAAQARLDNYIEINLTKKYSIHYSYVRDEGILCEYISHLNNSNCRISTNFYDVDTNPRRVAGLLYNAMKNYYNDSDHNEESIKRDGIHKIKVKQDFDGYYIQVNSHLGIECYQELQIAQSSDLFKCRYRDMQLLN